MAAIEILKPGKFTAMSGAEVAFSAEDMAAIAASYDPQLSEAPIVVGHPKDDAPAYGWIKSVAIKDGALVVEPHQVDPAFAELVQAGRYKKVSASFYKPDAPSNPKKGAYYLRHVGFLGAQPPAVKGLKAVSLAAGADDFVELADGWDIASLARLLRGVRDWILGKFGQEEADKAVPGTEIDYLLQAAGRDQARETSAAFAEATRTQPNQEVTTVDPKKTDELNRKETDLAEREKGIAAREAQLRRADDERFVEGLIAEGRVLPAQKDGVVAFMATLPDGATVELGEGDKATKTPAKAFFKDFLSKLPKAVDLSERAPSDKGVPSDDAVALSEAIQAKVHEEAGKGRTISYAEAAQLVTKGA